MMCTVFSGLFAETETEPVDKSRFEIEMKKTTQLVDPSASLEALNMVSEHGWNLLLQEIRKLGNDDLYWLCHRLNFLDYYCRNMIENGGQVTQDLEEYMPEVLVDMLNRLAAFKWL